MRLAERAEKARYGKPTRSVTITVNDEIYRRLKREAKARGMKVDELARFAILLFLSTQKQPRIIETGKVKIYL